MAPVQQRRRPAVTGRDAATGWRRGRRQRQLRPRRCSGPPRLSPSSGSLRLPGAVPSPVKRPAARHWAGRPVPHRTGRRLAGTALQVASLTEQFPAAPSVRTRGRVTTCPTCAVRRPHAAGGPEPATCRPRGHRRGAAATRRRPARPPARRAAACRGGGTPAPTGPAGQDAATGAPATVGRCPVRRPSRAVRGPHRGRKHRSTGRRHRATGGGRRRPRRPDRGRSGRSASAPSRPARRQRQRGGRYRWAWARHAGRFGLRPAAPRPRVADRYRSRGQFGQAEAGTAHGGRESVRHRTYRLHTDGAGQPRPKRRAVALRGRRPRGGWRRRRRRGRVPPPCRCGPAYRRRATSRCPGPFPRSAAASTAALQYTQPACYSLLRS